MRIENYVKFTYQNLAKIRNGFIFPPILTPNGTVQESKYYFSRKRYWFGNKAETSVLSTGYEIVCSNEFDGSVACITIFQSNVEWHKSASDKSIDTERRIIDDEEIIEKYPEVWEILSDKANTGLQIELRVIFPKKKRSNGWFTDSNPKVIKSVTRSCINWDFFGLLSSFGLFSQKMALEWRIVSSVFLGCASTYKYSCITSSTMVWRHHFTSYYL